MRENAPICLLTAAGYYLAGHNGTAVQQIHIISRQQVEKVQTNE
jgi:hypothetical protein